MGDEETKAAEAAAEKEAAETAAAEQEAADKAAADKEAADAAEAEKNKEEMVPVSRIRGLAKANAALEAKFKKLQKELDLKKREGMSAEETKKLEKEEAAAEIAEMKAALAKTNGKLKRAALRTYLNDARSPLAINNVPDELVDLDDNDMLTISSKAAINAWKQQPEVKGLFNPAIRGGNSPLAGDGKPITLEEYNKIKRDSSKTPEEKQAAHERFIKTCQARQ
jgi:hypothetical protein